MKTIVWMLALLSLGAVAERTLGDVPLLPTPVIYSFSPEASWPGSTISIYGTNFIGVKSILFNGVAATTFGSGGGATPGDFPLFAVVPQGAQTGPITVITSAGSYTSLTNFMVTGGPVPKITGFSAPGAVQGGDVTIFGDGLVDIVSIEFNGLALDHPGWMWFPAGTQVLTSIPADATSGPVTVITKWGQATSSTELNVQVVDRHPSISGFSPESAYPDVFISVFGTNLLNAISVAVSGVPTVFTQLSPDMLLVRVPTNAPSGPITVTTAAGTATSSQDLTIVARPAPTISTISPESAPLGATINLWGSYLDELQAVLFNGVPATVYMPVSDTGLIVTVPINCPPGPITVITSGGQATSTHSFTPLPTGNLLLTQSTSTDWATVGRPMSYTVSVTNYGPTAIAGIVVTNLMYLDDKWARPLITAGPTGQPEVRTPLPPETFTGYDVDGFTATQGTGTFVNQALSWSLGRLDVKAGASATFSIRPQAAGRLVHLAMAQTSDADLDYSNNFDVSITRVLAPSELVVQLVATNDCEISWPAAATNAVLQSSIAPDPQSDWQPTAATPVSDGDRFVLHEAVQTRRYYRLLVPAQ